MLNWAKATLANVAGTQEPIYGPDAIQTVTKQAKEVPYTELVKDDLRWITMESTCVETQTFYVMADGGPIGIAQVIYNNVAGLRTTVQFTSKLFYQDGKNSNSWASDALENYGFDSERYSLHADNCSVELSEDGSSYTIKSTTSSHSVVNLKFTRISLGFVVGKNGTTSYGTDPANPWGKMRHAFWPRCKVEGSIITQAGDVDMTGRGFFVHALQGMKPHHAAARWDFANFQSPNYSAFQMSFTTPPSYGSTVVNVGGLAIDDEIVFAGARNSATHLKVKSDADNDWPEPTAAKYVWDGKTKDGKDVHLELAGNLGERVDRVDVMAEVPGFIKAIVASAAGTKPYVYQFASKLTLSVKIGEEVKEEDGLLFAEATFIS